MTEAVTAPASRSYRYYDLIMAAFVTVLLCSNLIGASKVCRVGGFTFSAGVLFFPISYIFGDILTEVYGYARMRRVVWAGFASIFFAAFMSSVVLAIPASAEWGHQEAFQTVFGATPRIVVGSLVAYWAGEFCNSYVMAKLKLWTEGRLLFVRTIGSTILGQASTPPSSIRSRSTASGRTISCSAFCSATTCSRWGGRPSIPRSHTES